MVVMDKTQSPLRWLVLIGGNMILIGNYYCFDNPAALKTQLQHKLKEDDDAYELNFALMYSIYSFPNIVLPLIGGWACDKFGASRCLLVFALFLTAGQALFAFGVSVGSLPNILMGRVIFGFGGENCTVGVSALLADWFRGKEMALAMGLLLTIARLGSVINNFLSPRIAKGMSVSVAVWFGVILLGGGIASTCTLFPIERSVAATVAKAKAKAKEEDSENGRAEGLGAPLMKVAAEPTADGTEGTAPSPGCLASMAEFKPSFWMLTVSCLAVYGCVIPFNNVASSLLMERTYFKPNPDNCTLTFPDRCQQKECPANATNCIPNMPVGSGCLPGPYAPPLPQKITIDKKVYVPLEPDTVDCTSDKWKAERTCTYDFCVGQNAAESKSATAMSIPYMISAVASPFLGYGVDRFGGRAIIAAVCPIILILAHLGLGWATSLTPILPLIGQGIAYSVFAAALWPSVPFTVPKHAEGLAYGFVNAVQNGGLALFPLIVSMVKDAADDRYIPWAEFVFVIFGVVGLATGLALNVYDSTHGHTLNKVHLNEASVAPEDAAAAAMGTEPLRTDQVVVQQSPTRMVEDPA